MEIQKSIGEVNEAVKSLRADVKEHGDKLAHVEKVMYAAYAVGGLLILMGGFVFNKAWDPLMAALKAYAKAQP